MGFCREAQGQAWTESRRESFYFGVEDMVCIEGATQVEFHYRDLEDMIAALRDLAMNDSRYHEWVAKGKPAPEAFRNQVAGNGGEA